MSLMSGSKSVSSSPLEKLYPVGGNYISYSELPRTFLFMGQKERIFAGNHMLGTESTLNLSMTCLEASNQDILPQTNLFKQPAANGLHFVNSLFSGSLFGKKVGLMSSDRHFGNSMDATDTELKEDEPLESSKEVEAQTIGDLLPNDDDLLSSVIDDIEFVVQTKSGDEDDLFYSGGGMELESDESFNCKRASGFISAGNSQIENMNSKFPSELMYGKHPSRTLILRNIDSKIDGAELKILFEQFGDIRALYMASKHQGFVLVSYYDIRASNNAIRALQSRLLKQRKIDIHYYFLKDNASDKNITHATLIVSNLHSSVTNDDMHQIFGSYGEIKEIFYDPHCQNQRAIEFYDIRAAEAALCALNMSDIAGRRIKAEPGCPGVGWRCLGKLFPLELGKEGSIICRNGDSSNIPLLEIGDFGISVNECCPINGHKYVPNNSNANFHQPPGSLMWQNSLSFLNKIPPPSPQLQGLSRGPSHMLNTFIPLNHYHVGSAPALNPSIWERCSTYAGDCMEKTSFHPGSLGNMGFCGSPQMHPLGIASHSISPNAGLNCMDPSISLAHVGSPSTQQRSHLLHGRNRMSSLPASYDDERIRIRQSVAGANQTDNKKQFELDIDRISSGEDSRTTLMIKNIPNKYTSKMLLSTIDEHHKGTYDFIYLPIDFKNKCNVGYAFINLTEPKNIIPFHQAFNGKKWEKFNSEKVASLAYARIQGKSALIAHFQNSSLMNEDKRCRPILFHSDGPNAGDQEPFPVGTHIRSRPGRSRTTNNEDNLQRSPSDSGNRDDLSNNTYSSSSSIKDSE